MLSGRKPAIANEYDAIAEDVARDRGAPLKQSLFAAQGKQPDRHAQVMDLAKKLRVRPDYVDENFDELSKSPEIKAADYQKIAQDHPGLAKWLENPDNAALSSDDLESLGKIEKGVRVLPGAKPAPFTAHEELGRAAQTGFNDLSLTINNLAVAYGLTPPELAAQTGAKLANRTRELRAKAPDYAKEFQATLDQESGDVERAVKRFTGSYDSARQGKILQALKDFSVGGGQTVGETLDLIYQAGKRPGGLAYSITENLPASLPSMGLGAGAGFAGSALGPFGAIGGFVGGSFAGEYVTEVGSWINQALETRGVDTADPEQLLEAYRDPQLMAEIRGEAERKGVGTAAVSALFNLFAGSGIAKSAGEGVVKRATEAVKDVAVQGAGEAASEFAGQAAAKKDLGAASVSEALQEGIMGLGHEVGSTAIGASLRAKFSKDPVRAAEQVTERTQAAAQTLKDAQTLTEISQAAKESKVGKRMPEKLRELVQAAGGEGQTVYFQSEGWDAYWQSKGLSPAKAAEQVMGDAGRGYVEAKRTGAPIQVPLEAYVEKIATTEHAEGLLPVTQVREDGPTLQEAKEFLQSLPATMQELAQEANAPAQTVELEKPDNLRAKINEKLQGLGYRPEDADAYAQALEQRYRARAEILKADPVELFEKDSITIQRAGVDAPSAPAFDPMDSLLDRVRAGEIPSDREARGPSLVEFLRDSGGIKDEGGDVAAMEPDAERVPFRRNLVQEGGKSLDEAAILAAESGYIAEADPRALLDAIDSELRGQPTYSAQNSDQNLVGQVETLSRLRTQIQSLGLDLSKVDNAEAKRRIQENQGVPADVGFEQSARPLAPPFYSKLTRTVEEKMGGSATVEQINGMLREIKPEERKWSGIDEFLAGKEKVSKEELLAFLAANQLEVREVTNGSASIADGVYLYNLGGGDYGADQFAYFKDGVPVDPRTGEEVVKPLYFDTRNEAEEYIQRGVATKFAQYTLPGGENYREVLFTLPSRVPPSPPNFSTWATEIKGLSPEAAEAAWKARGPLFHEYQELNVAPIKQRNNDFRSSHFSEPNVLAHARLKDRETTDGKRVLFVEEIQSDWHQQGRKKGYRGDADAELAKLKEELAQIQAQVKESGKDASGATLDRATDILHRIQKIEGGSGVPDAPFRKTWHEFVLKRLIRMAAEGGYDAVAWTTGEQQAERYSLSNAIDELKVQQSAVTDGRYRLTAYKGGNEVLVERDITPGRVEELVGKEIAEKAIHLADTTAYNVGGSLKGLDLKVGGEGMKGFYDKILVDAAGKLGKKFGAKVEQEKIDLGNDLASKQDYSGPSYTTQELSEFAQDLDLPVEIARQARLVADHVYAGVPFKRAIEDFGSADLAKRLGGEFSDLTRKVEPVHSLPLSPALKDAALHEGFSLFQDDSSRGYTRFTPEGAFVHLGTKADLSTLHHEMAHIYLEQIRRDVETLNTSTPYQMLTEEQKAFLDDSQTILKWLGAESLDKITRDQHEQFARGYEAYLREGKAPSSALREAFSKFKAWMLAIYQHITQLNVKLTPEIRGVYDRLLATRAEIEEARTELGDITFPDEPEELTKAKEEALRAAEEHLGAKLIAQEMRKRTKDYEAKHEAMRETVAAEVGARPVYTALSKLQARDEDALKLSKTAIVREFGAERLKRLPRPYVYSVEGGIHPDAAASMFGFSSGDELLHALEHAPPVDEVIDALTDQRMKAEHGDLLSDGGLPEAAMESLHNEKRALLLRKRLEFLAQKRIGQFKEGVRRAARPLPTDQAMRAEAERLVAERKVREIKPDLYRRAETKSEREALDQFLKGDFEASYQAQLRALLNHELYRAAVTARDDIRKIRAFAKQIAKPARRARIGKAGEAWLAQVDGLLARYSFRSVPPDQIPDLRDFIKMVVEDQDEWIAASPEALDRSRVVHYTEASVGELRGVYDTLRSIEHVARKVNEVRIGEERLEREQAIEKMVARIHESLPEERPLAETEAEYSASEKMWNASKGFLDTTLRPEKIMERLDGGAQGIFHDVFWNPSVDAQVKRDDLVAKVIQPLLKLQEKMPKERRGRLDQKVYIPSLGSSLTRRTLIGVALNCGNTSNLEKLMRGGLWVGEEHFAIDQKMLYEMLGHLDAGDVEMVNTLWDAIGQLFPELDALNRRAVGLPLEKIEASPLKIPAGELKGGYWPAVADPRHSQIGEKQFDEDMQLGDLFPPKYAKAATPQSQRKTRTGAVYPIQLDWGQVLARHITKSVTDIAYHEYVAQARRLLESTPVKKAIQNRLGEHVRLMLDDWLRSQVNTPVHGYRGNDPIKIVMDTLLSNVAISALGFQVALAYKNTVTAIPQAWSQTDVSAMVKTFPKFLANPEQAYKRISEISGEMRHRSKNIDQTFSQIRRDLGDKQSLKRALAEFAMQVHSIADKYVTTWLWMARYQQAIDAKESTEQAMRLADKMVRTTNTAGAIKDLSSFERDPSYRWAKFFIGPLIVQLNEGRSAVAGKSVREILMTPSVWRKSVAVWVTASILWPLLQGRGPKEDDDPLEWAAIQFAFGPFTMIPFVRDGAEAVLAKIQGQRSFIRPNPIADAVITGADAVDALLDEDKDVDKKLTAALRGIGPLTGLPTNAAIQAKKLITNAQASESPGLSE